MGKNKGLKWYHEKLYEPSKDVADKNIKVRGEI